MQTPLGQQTAAWAADRPERSGFRILTNGVDGMLARIEMIDAATRTLDLECYIFRLDESGGLIAAAMLRAADRGVRVRVLLDDGDTAPGDERIAALDEHPNIELRIFNPFAYRGHSNVLRAGEFALRGGSVNYRMHNKLLVADNAIALIGGRNVGDAYFQIDPESHFGDDDLFAAGPIVRRMSKSFDEYWNSAQAIPAAALAQAAPDRGAPLRRLRASLLRPRPELEAKGLRYTARLKSGEPLAGILDQPALLAWGAAQLIVDSPDKRRVILGQEWGETAFEPVMQAMSRVKSELLIVTPFFVPGRKGMAVIEGLRRRGVEVRVLTNSLESTTELAVHSAYSRYRTQLLADGVKLFEVRAQLGSAAGSGAPQWMARSGHYSLHAKLFVFDRESIFIGSMNFDERSENINTEIGALIDSPDLARQTATRFEEITRLENAYAVKRVPGSDGHPPRLEWLTRKNGRLITLSKDPARSPLQRVKAGLMGLLPLDGEL
ncbi:MAG: phospholipase D family protein [Burkholderiales bacterium]|nr:phospholipase D family protein [Burkholderiales bacterium]